MLGRRATGCKNSSGGALSLGEAALRAAECIVLEFRPLVEGDVMKSLAFALVLAAGCVAGLETASAMPPFRKAFEDKYVKDQPNPAFEAAFKKALCNVCHVQGKPKTENNVYGQELAKLVEGSANERLKAAREKGTPQVEAETKKLLEELEAAFAKVEKVKVDPKAAASPTFGERIKQGMLPAP
jgi:hypothetical protein